MKSFRMIAFAAFLFGTFAGGLARVGIRMAEVPSHLAQTKWVSGAGSNQKTSSPLPARSSSPKGEGATKPSNSIMLPELTLYPLRDWVNVPASLLAESNTISLAVGLRGEGEKLNTKIAAALKLTSEETQLLENLVRGKMREWVQLIASHAVKEPNGTWRTPQNAARRDFRERYRDDLLKLLGLERFGVLAILAARDLDFYFGSHDILITVADEGRIKIHSKSLNDTIGRNVGLSEHLDADDPWAPVFKLCGLRRGSAN